ncbi:helix-turn-helix domain-containing protein [Claveliimonas bilis]|uniref:helix-turn-helix domain-containing protein n=1 Tax=Claveliimonas bilis TaxID=3028070 RepID=UPI002B2DB50F|nr:hypothetical protein Lac3_03700 [Claveliimonas bilis]
MIDEWLGKAIRKYLKENRYTQIYLSRKTGIPPDKLSASLNGKRRFTFNEYARICYALEVNTDKFLKPRAPDEKGE